MSFDWELYVQLSGELISYQRTPTLQEAYLRSAISRSYYGVFCIARNLLISKGATIPRTDTHKFIRTKYQRSPHRTEKEIGDGLRRLWRERKDADYEDRATVDIKRARTAHQLAIRVLDRLTNSNRKTHLQGIFKVCGERPQSTAVPVL